MARKNNASPEDFWREYEEKTGEKVTARGLGQYLSGWDEFGEQKKTPFWGLLIVTSGGFRFHHFPHVSWFDALLRMGSGGGSGDEEKTLFIPKERILAAELWKETRWWKKLLSPSMPLLGLLYREESGAEKKLILQADMKADELTGELQKLIALPDQCTSEDSV